MLNEEEDFEVQSIIKVYPLTKSALVLLGDNSVTVEPMKHLNNCDDCLIIRLNDLFDRDKEEDRYEKDFIMEFL